MLVGEHSNALWFWGKAELIAVGRGSNLSVCQWVDEFGPPAIRYKVFSNWDGNKVICDLVHHD